MKRLEPPSQAAIAALMSARHSFLARGALDTCVDEDVHRSWLRSSAYGIDPHNVRRQRPDPARLRRAQARERDLLEVAEPYLQLVDDVLGAEPHMVILTDADGLCLRLLAPAPQVRAEPGGNVFEGGSWNEREVGSNGMGSALATRAPFLVVGPQHFVDDYLHWTCVGVPLRGAGGAVAGVLNLSVQNDRINRHTWGWTLSLAQTIEAGLTNRARLGAQEELEALDDPLGALRQALDQVTADAAGTGAGRFVERARRDLAQAEGQIRGTIQSLREDRAQLEEWDRRKDDALTALAHELKSPLAVIFMLIEAAEAQPAAAPAAPTLAATTARLRRQAMRLSRLIKDVGDIARVKQGALALEIELVDLNQVVRAASDVALLEAKRKGQRLDLDLAEAELVVNGDPGRLEQVVINLLVNAVKYTPAGGSVLVQSAADGPEAVLRVRDTGVGIAPEDLERIFDSFTRVIPPSGDPGGMGIGLSLVANLVRLHNGTVEARSGGPGQGSEFEVRLPLPRSVAGAGR
jgi:signal transduction histidine kinase